MCYTVSEILVLMQTGTSQLHAFKRCHKYYARAIKVTIKGHKGVLYPRLEKLQWGRRDEDVSSRDTEHIIRLVNMQCRMFSR